MGGVIMGVLWDGWGYWGVIMGWVGLLLDRGGYCGGIMGCVGLLWGYYWMGSDGVPDPPYSALPPPPGVAKKPQDVEMAEVGAGS